MIVWPSLRSRHCRGALLIASVSLCGARCIRAQSAVSATDSIAMAQQAAAVVASLESTAGWFTTGFLLPPTIVAAAFLSALNWEKDKLPVWASAGATMTAIAVIRDKARRVKDPPSSVISDVLGDASPAVTASFVEAYRRHVHLKRRRSVNEGVAWASTFVLVTAGGLALYIAPRIGN